MYNLLIVDDEMRVREGLKKLIDWNSLGFQVVADVESAMKAISFVEQNSIDVMLTDVMMSEIDGLELLGRVKEINPHIKTVILSGYGEFRYAQKALRLGAFDFLTKPVDFEDLERIFGSIRAVLGEETIIEGKQKEHLKLEREQFLNNLVKGFYSKTDSFDKKLKELDIDLDLDCYGVIRIYVTKPLRNSEHEDISIDYNSLKQDIAVLMARHIPQINEKLIFNNDLCEIAAIVSNLDKEQFKFKLEDVKEEIKSNLKYTVHVGIGNAYSNVLQVQESYMEAGKALEYRIIKKDGSLLFYKDILNFFKGQALITDEIKNAISHHLLQMDEDGLIKYVGGVLDQICSSENINVNNLYDVCVEIFLTVNRLISSFHGEIKSIEANNRITIKDLLGKDSFEEIKEIMYSYIRDSLEIVKDSKDKTAGLIVENAKRYIQEHFGEDITLSRLSQVLYIHPNYLSKLFKEKTGENFIDYLTKVRIEKSKELLRDVSLKIYEVAELTGFCNPKYFGMTFKELAGLTPREFRNSIR